MSLRAVSLAAVPALAAGAAGACMPMLVEPTADPVAGEDCAIRWPLTEIRTIGLGPMTDLGGRRALQDAFDGNACYLTAHLVVHDCAAGTALVIGPDDRALADEPRQTGIDRIAAALQAGTLADPAAQAVAEGYPAPRTLPIDAGLALAGRSLPLDCACRALARPQGATQ